MFSIAAAKIVSPLTVHIFPFIYILKKTASWKYPLFDDSHSKRREIVSDCGFDLDRTDDESCRAHFHMPIDHLHVFLGKKIYFLYLSIGEGHGNPLQYSCLENSMDRGAWWATVHGIAKSWTRLSDSHSLTHLPIHTGLFGFLWHFMSFKKNVFWLYALYWLYVCIFSPFGMLTFHFVVEKLKFDLILVVNFCFCFVLLVLYPEK